MAVNGPITYQGQADVQRDLDNFNAALDGLQFEEAFVPSATPSRNDADPGRVYASEQAYLYALAEAMHEEYQAIVDAGFVVQLDLGLPARNQVLPGKPAPTWDELRRASEMQVEAYNHALQGIPQDRVRYHLCWGSMNTPHTTDVPLKDIVDLILKINAQAYSIEAANPRHEHEWMVWKDVKLPDGKILIPGIISHSTNVVEHPELVAWRIKNYASVVGKENVIAGTDCGFAQGWNMIRVHPEVQWAKLAPWPRAPRWRARISGGGAESWGRGSRSGLCAGSRLLGMFVKFPTIETTEILASAGHDFIIIDMEHAPLGVETVYGMIVAAERSGMAALVRLRGHETATANMFIDAGASGVLVPHCSPFDVARGPDH